MLFSVMWTEVHIVDIGVAAERQAVDEVGYILRSYRRRLVGGFQGSACCTLR